MGTLGHASWSPAGLDLGDQLAGRADEIEQRLTRFSGNSEISRLTSKRFIIRPEPVGHSIRKESP